MLHASFHVARRILIEFSRNRRVLILWIVFPILMLVLFGWVRAGTGRSLGEAFSQTAPGILIGAALFFSCLAGPTSILVGERERLTLRRLLLTPLTGEGYFVGVVLAHLVIAAVQTSVVYGTTYALGGGFEGSIALGIGIIVLSVVAYVGIGFFLGARFAGSTEDVNGPVAAIGVPLLVLGGTFFNTDVLPPFLYAIAQVNPIFHMNEALKSTAFANTAAGGIGFSTLALVVFAFAAIAVGAHSYRAMLSSESDR